MLTAFDYAVIAIYFIGVTAFGLKAGGRQGSPEDYFLGKRSLPWWAVCFSVVATETSTLTVIGIPAVAYGGTLTFFQLTFGYLLGRVVVSLWFLPHYFKGDLQTAYAFLGNRYGNRLRGVTSVTFLVTRLLADGVRLFATAIPIKVIAASAGYDVSYFTIILWIGLFTMAYTYVGGIKAVVWIDVVQMAIYVGGGGLALWFLLDAVPAGWWTEAQAAGKTFWFDHGLGTSLNHILTQPYTLVTAVIGGGIFSMASHGTDQLIVQRLLSCRSLEDSRRALIGSALMVMVQFALFLAVGLLLWAYYQGAPLDTLGLGRGDEVFPKYIIEGLPSGLSGLLLAGILAAAMSTLSSSLNALASSTVYDLYEKIRGRVTDPVRALRLSRGATLFWGVVFIGFATLFEDRQNPVVELGLSIASFTYGGLLGAFLLGFMVRRTDEWDALLAFGVAIVTMVFIIFGVWYGPSVGWVFDLNPSDARLAEWSLRPLAWPWYTVIGAFITLITGSLCSLRHR